MPLVLNDKGRLEPIFLNREKTKQVTFLNAREHQDYLKANPEMAQRIADADATKVTPLDKLAASNQSLRAAAEKLETVTRERNAMEAEAGDLRDQLAAAKAELEVALARQRGSGPQVHNEAGDPDADVRTGLAPTPRKRRTKAEIQAAKAAAAG
jgi:hypothetical protein